MVMKDHLVVGEYMITISFTELLIIAGFLICFIGGTYYRGKKGK